MTRCGSLPGMGESEPTLAQRHGHGVSLLGIQRSGTIPGGRLGGRRMPKVQNASSSVAPTPHTSVPCNGAAPESSHLCGSSPGAPAAEAAGPADAGLERGRRGPTKRTTNSILWLGTAMGTQPRSAARSGRLAGVHSTANVCDRGCAPPTNPLCAGSISGPRA